jgi:signal transduction histidine kinase/DNA-binding response OmpR family regulator
MLVPLQVLIVEDSPDDALLLVMELRRGGWEVSHERVDTPQAMATALNARPWDLIIADYAMPQFSGCAALAMARERSADIPFILISGQMGEETAVHAMQAGADDYLFKGNLHRLAPAVERELHDAAGRRKAEHTERQLQKGERQLADAQRLAHLGTWHADLRTNIAVWSEEACRILGCPPGGTDFTFQKFLACLHADDRILINAAMASSNQAIISQDCGIACPNIAAQFLHLRGEFMRDENGKVIEAAGMIQDITERRLVDVQLKHAKEAAEAASLAKSEFLANMSHEIRTPMTAIVGFAEMLLQPNQKPQDRTESIHIIRRNAEQLLELINEILDLSKIEAGKMTVEKIACDLPQMLADVSIMMRPRALEKALAFEIKFTGSIPRRIQTDCVRFRQILVNLLGNAIKFTEAGRVGMQVCFEGSDARNILRVAVSDSGIGMNQQQMDRLFQPFTQADESTTRRFGGTGLGLTISRRLARLLGGDISIKSTPGVGSTFALEIGTGPLTGVEMLEGLDESKLPAAVSDLSNADILIRGHILLAEDGRDNQRLISTHLISAGAQVTIARNGKLAVDLASAQPFDLILMDMQMPVMDGYTATAELRRRGFGVPIVALTANAMSEDRAKCLASGCSDYLSKPLGRETLLNTIAKHLNQSLPPSGPPPIAPTEEPVKQAASSADGQIVSSMGQNPKMKKIISEFVEELPGDVQKMQVLLNHSNLESLQRVVHQLRGAGGSYGFDPITEWAAKAEDSIKAADNLESITQQIISLIDVIHHVQGFDESRATTPSQGEEQ